MTDLNDLKQWFERRKLPPERWTILALLSRMKEWQLRDVLRPHQEVGYWKRGEPRSTYFEGERYFLKGLRDRLDKALGALTYIEMGLQISVTDSNLDPLTRKEQVLPATEQQSLETLFNSDAFLRYVNVYLFFGIRFLAARLSPEPFVGCNEKAGSEAAAAAGQTGQINRPPLPLSIPPVLNQVTDALAGALINRRPLTADEDVALRFLDGFRVVGPGEAAEIQEAGVLAELEETHETHLLELWLRGLKPDLPPVILKNFESITRGLESWANAKAEFYLKLSPSAGSAGTTPFTKREEGWRCDTPLAARLAIADIYWLSGTLRADVTPKGNVTYTAASWLSLLRFRLVLDQDKARGVQSVLPGRESVSQAGLEAARALQNREQQLRCTEEILRSVFSVACELVQNASEIREREEKNRATLDCPAHDKPGKTLEWRAVFDKEMEILKRQRLLRNYLDPDHLDGARGEPPPGDPGNGPVGTSAAKESGTGPDEPGVGWSERVTSGESERDLVGLAFSGGGIRSATFNLGVLQGLQELDLLRQVDYLSTVSGGGFIGSWLIGNVKRSHYWLGRLASWKESIAHLRAYSNYLAPRPGVLSMDTWSLATLWVRNASLIQLTGLAWLLALFTAIYCVRRAFVYAVSQVSSSTPHVSLVLALLMALCVVATVIMNLLPGQQKRLKVEWKVVVKWLLALVLLLLAVIVAGQLPLGSFITSHEPDLLRKPGPFSEHWPIFSYVSRLLPLLLAGVVALWLGLQANSYSDSVSRTSETAWVRYLAVFPAWIGAASIAAHLFGESCGGVWKDWLYTHSNPKHPSDYSTIFVFGPGLWSYELCTTFVAFSVLSGFSLHVARKQRAAPPRAYIFLGALSIALACTLVVHLCFSAILYAGLNLRSSRINPDGLTNAAFVFGPALVLLAYALGILLLIGLSGKHSNESQREWWTRFGGWILVFAWMGIAFPGVLFGGPWLLEHVVHRPVIRWGALVTWLGTVAGGLLSGRSSRTSGKGTSKSPPLDWLAKAGGLFFLVGAALGTAELLFFFFQAMLDNPPPTISTSIAKVCWGTLLWTLAALLICGWVFSEQFEINIFGLNQLYRNRLVRCYLGATRWMPGIRKPEPFTGFDFEDDMDLCDLGNRICNSTEEFRGPFPVLSCSLNLGGSADLTLHTRHSASFALTPLYCGSSRPRVGYAPSEKFANKIRLGQAVAISGAAASPNMGYNTSPLVALLLTLFNVRLGWWFPNPGRKKFDQRSLRFSLWYMLRELFGLADENSYFLNVSDGGHFENLGIYELVRRRCKVIFACDAECDEDMQFGGLANAVRLCETDFGATIEVDVTSLRPQQNGKSLQHGAVGTIKYSDGSIGRLIYLKASMTGDEDVSVAQYQASHPSFPHQSTANQFYSEDQFESYRRLGHHVLKQCLRSVVIGERPVRVSERLADMLAPSGSSSETFLRHSRQLDALWERLRKRFRFERGPRNFLSELMGSAGPAENTLDEQVICIGLEILQLMEDIFLDLRLDDFWERPDNRGWAMLFMNWARSPRLREIWKLNHRTFGVRFEHFCADRLGLVREYPVVRVTPLIRD